MPMQVDCPIPRSVSSLTIWYVERARARHQPHPARHADLAGDDPDVATPGRDEAGAVRPDERRRLARRGTHGTRRHVGDRDALGDAHDERDARVGGLEDGVGGERAAARRSSTCWRRSRARPPRRCRTRESPRRPGRPSRASRRRRRWSRRRGCGACGTCPRSPVRPWTTTSCRSSMRTPIARRRLRQHGAPRPRPRPWSRRARSGVAGLGEDPPALLRVRAVQPDHDRHVRLDTLAAPRGCPAPPASQRVIPPKMLMNTQRTAGSDSTTSQRGRHQVGARAAADVEEVRRAPARLRHDVERRHHQPGAVADDADLAVELHVLQADVLRLLLDRVHRELRPASASSSGWRNSALSSIVTLASSATTLPSLEQHERVDLDERGVGARRAAPTACRSDVAPRPRGPRPAAARRASRTCEGRRSRAAGRRGPAAAPRAARARPSSMSMPPSEDTIARYSPPRPVQRDRGVELAARSTAAARRARASPACPLNPRRASRAAASRGLLGRLDTARPRRPCRGRRSGPAP